MKFKSLAVIVLSTMSILVSAGELVDHKRTIDAFFNQYEIIGTEGFEQFATQRSGLFADDSQTIVNDETRVQYQGKAGHIQSLKDWFEVYRTGNDFSYNVTGEVADDVVEVELFGTLNKLEGSEKSVIDPQSHKWREYFTFNADGKIEQLQIDMNILSDTYDKQARAEFSPNDIAGFVYQWFAAFDHQRESGYFLQRIAEPVDMHYPDYPIDSYEGFLGWYKGVTDNIVWNSHDLKGLEITGNQTSGWNVTYDVVWKAKAKNSEKYDVTVHQELRVIEQDGQLKLAKLEAKMAE